MGRHRLAEMVDEEQAPGTRPRRWSIRTVIAALGVTLGLLGAAAAWAVATAEDSAGPRSGSAEPGTTAVVGSAQDILAGSGADSPGPSGSPEQQPPTSQPAGPSAAGARFTADYDTTSQWATGFVGEIVVRNLGGRGERWTVEVTLPLGASVVDVWNAEYQTSGAIVRFYRSGELAPGGAASFGFRVEAKGRVSGLDSCTIGGQPCT